MKMPGEELATIIFRVVLGVLLIGGAWWAIHSYNETITAPVKTELNVSRANNAGFKAGAEAQNKGTASLKAEGEKRQAEGRKAVESAGKPQAARAEEILKAPCTWAKDDYGCANGRINKELGLR